MGISTILLYPLCRDDWSIGSQRVVNPRVRHQIGLEFIEIDIEGSIKSQ